MIHAPIIKLSKLYISNYLGLPRECWQGILLSLFESILIGIFYFLSIYFTTILKFNISLTGSIISAYGLGSIIGGFVGGKISDKISSMQVCIFSLLVQAFCYFCLIKLKTVLFIFADIALLGIATYSFITSNYLFVLNKCCDEGQRLKAINILSTCSNLGLCVSALIVALLNSFGFHILFFLSGLSLTGIGLYLIFQKKKKTNKLIPTNHKNFIEKEINQSKGSNNQIRFLMLTILFLIGIIISQMNSTYPVYIKTNFSEYGIKFFSFLFILNASIVVIFETPIGNLSKHFNKFFMVSLGSLFIGCAMLSLWFYHLLIIVIFSCIFYTLGEIIFFSMVQLIYYQNSETQRKGHHLGLYRMIYASSRVFGPYLGSIIYYNYGADITWLFCGTLGITVFLTCFIYSKLSFDFMLMHPRIKGASQANAVSD